MSLESLACISCDCACWCWSCATWAGVFPDYAWAQNTMSSGSAREPRYDAQGRVITAGGFVATGPVIFQDVTTAAGLSPPHPAKQGLL